jgi:general secretion pathway protein K
MRGDGRPALLAEPRHSRGFALLIVLWVLVLIGFLVAHVVVAGRTELRIAGNLYANAAAEAALEGAVNEALFHLSDPQPERAWRLDGRPHELTIGHSRIVLRIDNEAAHINPNFASPAVLERLLGATGSDAATARQLATAIAEWVGNAVAGRSPETVAADYWVAGLGYTPPRQPMESLDELARVLGMTPAVLAAIRPHLTLYGPQTPDPTAADPIVAAALAFVGESPGGVRVENVPRRRGGRVVTARIHATAHGPDNAEITRAAVVRFNPEEPQRSVMLAWGPSIE